jgi:hypothetical protein
MSRRGIFDLSEGWHRVCPHRIEPRGSQEKLFASSRFVCVAAKSHRKITKRKRSFNSLSEAEEENGQSRIYLGIHWAFDKSEGDFPRPERCGLRV